MAGEGAGQRGRVGQQRSGVKQGAAYRIKGIALPGSRTLSEGCR